MRPAWCVHSASLLARQGAAEHPTKMADSHREPSKERERERRERVSYADTLI